MAARNEPGAKKPPARNTSNPAQTGRKSPPPRQTLRRYWAILFWLAFLIVIYGLFLFNREAISNSFRIIREERMMARENVPAPLPPPPLIPVQPAPAPQHLPALPPALLPETPLPLLEPVPPPALPPGPVELRERTLYFTQIDRGGNIFRAGVSRSLPVSATPMTDVLLALIAGPNEDERRRGLISLIPPGTQILSATVRAETAYINFTEDFLYNTYGADGYVGQLRQLIYTVTEFPNVNDVQILIEGQRVEFLGKGIWIGSPIRRGVL